MFHLRLPGFAKKFALCLLFAGCVAAGEDGHYRLTEDFRVSAPDWQLRGNGKGELQWPIPGVLRLEADFTGLPGSHFVTAARRFITPLRLAGVCFKMRGQATGFDVRLVDAGSQIHQFYLKPTGSSEEFQEFRLAVAGSSKHHWNGENDGVIRQPIRQLQFGVHGWQLPAKKGVLEFTGIRFLTPDGKAAGRVEFRADEPERLFRQPGDVEPIRLRLAAEALDETARRYFYSDYQGNQLAEGVAVFDPEHRLLTASPPPGRGFAELVYPALGIRAGVMTDDPPPREADEFFAVDSSFSWGSPPAGEREIRAYLRILKRCGILWNRDRLSWSAIAPAPDRFQFDGRYGLYRRLAEEEGIRTLDVFHDTPDWLEPRRQPKRLGPVAYPSKLKEAGENWARILDRWQGTTRALEVWNEPDLSPYPYPDQIAGFTKALSRQLRGNDTVIVGGVFAHPWPGTALQEACLANGMLDAVDAMSYHTYADVGAMEATFGGLRERESALRHPRAGIPIWITECGTPWTEGGGRAIPSQDRFSAAEIVGKAVELRALGAERYFAFEFKFYQEGRKNFGMMDARDTPMRSMAAYAHAAKILAGKAYIGDLTGVRAVRSRVFSDGTAAVAALYVPADGKRTALKLPAGFPPCRITGIDGRPLAVRNGGVDCRDGVVYLHFPEAAAKAFLKSDTRAMKYFRMARDFDRKPRATPPVVFRSLLDVSTMTADAFGYNLAHPEDVRFDAALHNLSDETKVIQPALLLPEGCRTLEFEEKELRLAPGEVAPFTFRLAFAPQTGGSGWRLVRLIDRNREALPLAWSIRLWKMATAPVPAATPESRRFDLPTLAAAKDWIDFSAGENWRSWQGGEMEPNIRAKFRAFHTPEALQIQVLVNDPSFHQPYGASEAWRGDSLQIALQQRGPDGKPPAKRYWNEVTAAQTGGKGTLFGNRGTPAGLYRASRLEFHPLGGGNWLYVVHFDAAELKLDLSPGSKIGFSLLVNSNSGKGRDGFLTWGGGIAGNKSHSEFNCLEIKEKK